jgi:hypothetical protein
MKNQMLLFGLGWVLVLVFFACGGSAGSEPATKSATTSAEAVSTTSSNKYRGPVTSLIFLPIHSELEPAIVDLVEQHIHSCLERMPGVNLTNENIPSILSELEYSLADLYKKEKAALQALAEKVEAEQVIIIHLGTLNNRYTLFMERYDLDNQTMTNSALSETRSKDRLNLACERGLYRLFGEAPPSTAYPTAEQAEFDRQLQAQHQEGYFEDSYLCPTNPATLVISYKTIQQSSDDEKQRVMGEIISRVYTFIESFPQITHISGIINFGDMQLIFHFSKQDARDVYTGAISMDEFLGGRVMLVEKACF